MVCVKLHLFLVIHLQILFIDHLGHINFLNFLIFLVMLLIDVDNLTVILRLPFMFRRFSCGCFTGLHLHLFLLLNFLQVLLIKTGIHKQFPLIHVELKINIVPKLHKMPGQINHRLTTNAYGHIMPWHPWHQLTIDCALEELFWFQDIGFTVIAVIDSWPELLIWVQQAMLVVIVAAVSDVQATHEGHFLIDDYHFLVVRPKKRNQQVSRMP